MIELPEIHDAQRLALGPDDILVVRVQQPIGIEHANALKAALRERIGTEHRVLIMDSGMDISVLTPEELAARLDPA